MRERVHAKEPAAAGHAVKRRVVLDRLGDAGHFAHDQRVDLLDSAHVYSLTAACRVVRTALAEGLVLAVAAQLELHGAALVPTRSPAVDDFSHHACNMAQYSLADGAAKGAEGPMCRSLLSLGDGQFSAKLSFSYGQLCTTLRHAPARRATRKA